MLNLITYADKAPLNENADIPDENKCNASDLNEIKNVINNLLFPVGSIIFNDNEDFNPNTLYGGTWERIKGRCIVGVDEDSDDFPTHGITGGEVEHTLTVQEMPSHSHDMFSPGYASQKNIVVSTQKNDPVGRGNPHTGNTGGGKPHNNMPPYYTGYIWRRTA